MCHALFLGEPLQGRPWSKGLRVHCQVKGCNKCGQFQGFSHNNLNIQQRRAWVRELIYSQPGREEFTVKMCRYNIGFGTSSLEMSFIALHIL